MAASKDEKTAVTSLYHHTYTDIFSMDALSLNELFNQYHQKGKVFRMD